MTQFITFTQITDDGTEIDHKLPAKFEVCSRCDGNGTHTNPAIDGNGLSVEDFDADPDFAEDYMNGRYDVTCETCKGLRVVPVVDEERCDKALLEAYYNQQEDNARFEAECAAERRAEMGWA